MRFRLRSSKRDLGGPGLSSSSQAFSSGHLAPSPCPHTQQSQLWRLQPELAAELASLVLAATGLVLPRELLSAPSPAPRPQPGETPPIAVPPLPTTPGQRAPPRPAPKNSGLRNPQGWRWVPARQLRPRASAARRGAGGGRALLGPPGPRAQRSPRPRGGSTARAARSSAGAATRIPAPPVPRQLPRDTPPESPPPTADAVAVPTHGAPAQGGGREVGSPGRGRPCPHEPGSRRLPAPTPRGPSDAAGWAAVRGPGSPAGPRLHALPRLAEALGPQAPALGVPHRTRLRGPPTQFWGQAGAPDSPSPLGPPPARDALEPHAQHRLVGASGAGQGAGPKPRPQRRADRGSRAFTPRAARVGAVGAVPRVPTPPGAPSERAGGPAPTGPEWPGLVLNTKIGPL